MQSRAFSMIEILVSLMVISFAFLPIYNLFRFSRHGVWSNEKEIIATNYASDMINFLRERKAKELETAMGTAKEKTLANDSEIAAFFGAFNPPIEPPPAEPTGYYTRTLSLKCYDGKDPTLIGRIMDWILKRQSVLNYLVEVRVAYSKKQLGAKEGDEVVLYSIVMD